MMLFQSSKHLPMLLLILLSLASLMVVVSSKEEEEDGYDYDDFTEITTTTSTTTDNYVPQQDDVVVSAVFLPTGCTKSGKIPKTMFTLEPAAEEDDDMVTIFTYPKDLVTVNRSGSRIYIQWNNDVAKDANEGGGVRIFFPRDQLKKVDVADSTRAQILDGFTSIESLSISSSATLQATFTSLISPIQTLRASSSAKGTVISNAGFEKVTVSSSAKLTLDGDVQERVSVSSSAKLMIHGSVGAGSVSSSGKIYLDGDITGAFSASSSAKLYAMSISTAGAPGSVSASSSATVYSSLSSDCENVKTNSSARCKVSNIDEVTVEIDKQPFTLEGTDTCNWGWKEYGMIAASVSLLLVVSTICLITCCCSSSSCSCCWWKRGRRRTGRRPADSMAVVAVDKNGLAVLGAVCPAPVVAGAVGGAGYHPLPLAGSKEQEERTALKIGVGVTLLAPPPPSDDAAAVAVAGADLNNNNTEHPTFAHAVVISTLDHHHKEPSTSNTGADNTVPFADTTPITKKDDTAKDPGVATNMV